MNENDDVDAARQSADNATESANTIEDATPFTTNDEHDGECAAASDESVGHTPGGDADTPDAVEDSFDEFLREYYGDDYEIPLAKLARRRPNRRPKPGSADSSNQGDLDSSLGATAPQLPAGPPKPKPIDLAFDLFKKWIEEREKAVARRVQKSGVALDDVARMGALALVHLEQKYPSAEPEGLRPMINALLEPLEYDMRFDGHRTAETYSVFTQIYIDITCLMCDLDSDGSGEYQKFFVNLKSNAAIAETVFRALREATKPRPDPSFRPTAWLTADEDLVRTNPVPQGTARELMDQLHDMTGLDSVKNVVRGQAAKIQVDARRAELGLSIPTQTRHVLFHGNPGTGKTTVARIIAGIYRSVGLLYNDHIVETDSSGLVSKWRGQTPQKTNAAIDEAIGGVLFIDEAYSLVSDEGQQAIDTLVKRMEDDREDLIVILAGYPDKMAKLLDTNPGLASRIGLTIDFPDYTNSELMDILDLMLKESDYEMADTARMHIQRRLESVKRDADFGNAPTVRNVFESATSCQAIRLGEVHPEKTLTLEQVTELTAGDFDQAMNLVFRTKSHETGFGFGTPGGCVMG